MRSEVKRRTVAELLAAQREREGQARGHAGHELLLQAIEELDDRTGMLEEIRDNVRFLARLAKLLVVALPVALAAANLAGGLWP